MKLRVQFFSHLKEIVGAGELEISPKEGATAGQLLAELYERYPKLRDWDSSILIGAGVEFVERDYVLQSGDRIAIMPPMQGG